jgi:hypothetical protein
MVGELSDMSKSAFMRSSSTASDDASLLTPFGLVDLQKEAHGGGSQHPVPFSSTNNLTCIPHTYFPRVLETLKAVFGFTARARIIVAQCHELRHIIRNGIKVSKPEK